MIFTTSWDDGNKLDMRLAKLLSEYEMRGTFYIPINWRFKSLSDKDVKKISKKFEIGSHSISHLNMTKLQPDEIFLEAAKSKAMLEKITKKKIKCFAYPFGFFNDIVAKLVKRAGYVYARTTEELQITRPENLFKSGFTISVTNRARRVFLTRGLINVLKNRFEWERIAKALFAKAMKAGGIFHLQGHSWEIEEAGKWESLIEFFDYVSKFDDIEFMTNGKVADYCLNNNR